MYAKYPVSPILLPLLRLGQCLEHTRTYEEDVGCLLIKIDPVNRARDTELRPSHSCTTTTCTVLHTACSPSTRMQ